MPQLPKHCDQTLRPHRVGYTTVLGEVVAVYLDHRFIHDGIVDTGAMCPLVQLGYMDYAVVTLGKIFALNRPAVRGR